MNGRQTFETIYKKLEKELHERKKEMVNVLEISNIAYEARDQAYNEISALRAQNDKELMMFEAEKVELNAQVRAVLRRWGAVCRAAPWVRESMGLGKLLSAAYSPSATTAAKSC